MTQPTLIPARAQVAVIGGGPAGSSAATLLAREGIDVVLIERDKFPRYHIGESLLNTIHLFSDILGVREKIEASKQYPKYAAYFRVKQGEKAGRIGFGVPGGRNHAYHVVRSEFDQLLLQHSAEQGARVFEETRVQEVNFEGERPVSLVWEAKDGTTGTLAFDYLVDASGVTGFLSNKHLKNRVFQPYFDNIAVGRYWRGQRPYVDDNGVEQSNVFFLEAIPDGSGWVWGIPLNDGTISVGIVVHSDTYKSDCKSSEDLEDYYRRVVMSCGDFKRCLDGAEICSEVFVWKDYSYAARHFGGSYFRLAGDAAGFIDPFFSTGVHMAFLGATSAAATICASMRGEVDESEAWNFHSSMMTRSYTAFMFTVAGVYRQLRNQREIVLPGVTNDRIAETFSVLQPLISGSMALDAFDVPEDAVPRLAEFLGRAQLSRFEDLHETDASVNLIGTRRPELFGANSHLLETTRRGAVNGLFLRLERGRLGLNRISSTDQEQNQREDEEFLTLLRTTLESVKGSSRVPVGGSEEANESPAALSVAGLGTMEASDFGTAEVETASVDATLGKASLELAASAPVTSSLA